jgi:hypothetical protein
MTVNHRRLRKKPLSPRNSPRALTADVPGRRDSAPTLLEIALSVRWHQTCLREVEKLKNFPTFPLFELFHLPREGPMSVRLGAGVVAAVVSILTLIQLFWMFGMFSPADALGGRTGAAYAIALAAWFLITLALLVAAAIILLMTRDDAKTRVYGEVTR